MIVFYIFIYYFNYICENKFYFWITHQVVTHQVKTNIYVNGMCNGKTKEIETNYLHQDKSREDPISLYYFFRIKLKYTLTKPKSILILTNLESDIQICVICCDFKHVFLRLSYIAISEYLQCPVIWIIPQTIIINVLIRSSTLNYYSVFTINHCISANAQQRVLWTIYSQRCAILCHHHIKLFSP